MAYHPFRHLGLKFLSVTVAFGLWFTLAGEETVERTLNVALEMQNRPERLELVENLPQTVLVRVRGRSGLLAQMAPGEVTALIDLSNAKVGRRYFPLTREDVRAPFGVEVVEVRPGNIPLRFELSLTRSVPVVASVEGEPAAGYLAGKPTVEPGTVEVSGPASAVDWLKEVSTEPVSLDGARSDVVERVTVGTPDPSVRLDTGVTATVRVPVAPLPVERMLAQVPVHLRETGKAFSAQALPSAVAVTIRGAAEVVGALTPDAVAAHVDLAGLGPGRYNLSVHVDKEQPFAVVRIDPSSVTVRIK